MECCLLRSHYLSTNFKIRVVATDGNSVKKIMWIYRTASNISFGLDIKNWGGHITYHHDGQIHYRHGKETPGKDFDMGKKIPLKDFKGTVQITNMGINLDEFQKMEFVDFDFKKVDGIVYIDLRTIPSQKKILNIDLQLAEENNLGMIYHRLQANNIHVFKFSNPWVILSIW